MKKRQRSLLAAEDPELITDLDIISLQQPGRGPALGRIILKSGLTRKQIAEKLGLKRTGRITIQNWISESRWPPQARIRELLIHCGIDRKLLIDRFGLALDTESTPASNVRELLVTLRSELMFTFDAFERVDCIFNATYEKVLMFQAFKAFEDTRAAALFFDRWDRHQDMLRRRANDSAKVSAAQSVDWLASPYVPQPEPEPEAQDPTDPLPEPTPEPQPEPVAMATNSEHVTRDFAEPRDAELLSSEPVGHEPRPSALCRVG